MIILVVGGSRSGKSAFAEDLLRRAGAVVTYIATGIATDSNMAERIEGHRVRRPATWSTLESTGADLPAVLRDVRGPVLLDALGTWVASFEDLVPATGELVGALSARASADSSPTVIVTDEVGLGVHPETDIGRRFRDELGSLNQAVAAIADDVVLVAAGRAIRLERLDLVAADIVAGFDAEGSSS